MDLSKLTVKQLRAKAKEVGISPLPSRKADLIGALQSEEHQKYTLHELRRICSTHKEQLSFKCNEKGLTRDVLLRRLGEAGLLDKKVTFFTELKQRAPGIVAALENISKRPSELQQFFTSREAQKTEKDIWGRFLAEYDDSVAEGLEELLQQLDKTRQLSEDVSDELLSRLATAAPLIIYSYARQDQKLYSRLQKLQVPALAELAELLKGTDLALAFEMPQRSGYIEESLLGELPEELQYEIFRQADLETKRNLLQTSNAIRNAESYYRAVHATYGSLTLTVAQNIALEWLFDVLPHNRIAIVKAPPSWGKTALSVATAIEALREDRRVTIHTTSAMVPFFLETLQKMLGSQFPDMSKGPGQAKRVSLLVPSAKQVHREAYKRGENADMLLLGGPEGAGTRFEELVKPYLRQGQGNRLPHPVEQYSPDLVIIDEAHKGNVSYVIGDYLRRLPDVKFVLVSANDVKNLEKHFRDNKLYLSYQGIHFPGLDDVSTARLQFSAGNILSSVPSLTVEIRNYPESRYRALDARDLENNAAILNPYAYMDLRNLVLYLQTALETHKELSGNTVAFVKFAYGPPRRGVKQLAEKETVDGLSLWDLWEQLNNDESIIVNRKKADLARFTKRSATQPTIFFTTYNKSAEGLNLNTIDNVLLFEASESGRNRLYQAVARAQRTNNPRHKVRVIAYSFPGLAHYVDVATKMVREDFLEDMADVVPSVNVNFTEDQIQTAVAKTLDSGALAPMKGSLLIYYLLNTTDVSAAELYFLFSGKIPQIKKKTIFLANELKRKLNALFDKYKMFTTLDRDVLINMKGRLFSKLVVDREEVEEAVRSERLLQVRV